MEFRITTNGKQFRIECREGWKGLLAWHHLTAARMQTEHSVAPLYAKDRYDYKHEAEEAYLQITMATDWVPV